MFTSGSCSLDPRSHRTHDSWLPSLISSLKIWLPSLMFTATLGFRPCNSWFSSLMGLPCLVIPFTHGSHPLWYQPITDCPFKLTTPLILMIQGSFFISYGFYLIKFISLTVSWLTSGSMLFPITYDSRRSTFPPLMVPMVSYLCHMIPHPCTQDWWFSLILISDFLPTIILSNITPVISDPVTWALMNSCFYYAIMLFQSYSRGRCSLPFTHVPGNHFQVMSTLFMFNWPMFLYPMCEADLCNHPHFPVKHVSRHTNCRYTRHIFVLAGVRRPESIPNLRDCEQPELQLSQHVSTRLNLPPLRRRVRELWPLYRCSGGWQVFQDGGGRMMVPQVFGTHRE
jgi:hypothetical protein